MSADRINQTARPEITVCVGRRTLKMLGRGEAVVLHDVGDRLIVLLPADDFPKEAIARA